MSKTRSDSLHALLTPEQREDLLTVLVDQGASLLSAQALCKGWGVSASLSRLSRFLSSHGLQWRLEQARARAEAAMETAPPDLAEATRRGMALQEYSLAFKDLSAKELAAFLRIDVQRERTKNDSRRVALLEAKLKEAEEVTKDETMTPEQKAARYKEVFGMAA